MTRMRRDYFAESTIILFFDKSMSSTSFSQQAEALSPSISPELKQLLESPKGKQALSRKDGKVVRSILQAAYAAAHNEPSLDDSDDEEND